MREPIQLLGIYLHLARNTDQRQQLLQRDKVLVMCGMLAAQMNLPSVDRYCRAQILRHNPGHMVRRWPSFAIALHDADFQHFLKQIQRRYSLETAERMTAELGIEIGSGEREAYYTDEEYAAAILGTSVQEMRGDSEGPA